MLNSKSIFITGATGFIGSHLAELCVDCGFNVVAFDRYNPNNHWGWLENSEYKNEIKVILGDVRDYDSVSKAMKDCDVVFHLAALIGIPYSYLSPLAYIRTNVEGTYNVLEAVKNLNVDKVIITSTSEVYGTAKYVPIDENHPKQPQSPYSASKISADALADSFYKSFNLPVIIARPFNTYGPRQSARAIIPAIITQLLSGKEEIELGSIHPRRDMVFVKDTVNAFIEIAKSDQTVGETINIATQSEISIGDLAQKLIAMINPQARIVKDNARVRPQSSEVHRLLGSNEKIMRLTNWKQKHNLDEGLKETIEWFKDCQNFKLYKAEIYNV